MVDRSIPLSGHRARTSCEVHKKEAVGQAERLSPHRLRGDFRLLATKNVRDPLSSETAITTHRSFQLCQKRAAKSFGHPLGRHALQASRESEHDE